MILWLFSEIVTNPGRHIHLFLSRQRGCYSDLHQFSMASISLHLTTVSSFSIRGGACCHPLPPLSRPHHTPRLQRRMPRRQLSWQEGFEGRRWWRRRRWSHHHHHYRSTCPRRRGEWRRIASATGRRERRRSRALVCWW